MRFGIFNKIGFLTISVILILCGIRLSAQEVNLRTFNYSRADSIAIHFPKDKYKTYKEFIKTLTAKLTTDQEKFCAIYRWIAENIAYSYSNMSIGADKALNKRKAVCAGYSSLLMEMCSSVGLECNMITGWAKIDQSCFGNKEPNHAWNEVKLNGNWYLTDITWGSGYFDKKRRKYYKDFDTAYFLPTPEFFAMQHLPMDKSKSLMAKQVSKSKFLKTSVLYEGAAEYGVKPINHRRGCFGHDCKKELTLKLQMDKEEEGGTAANFDIVIDGDGATDYSSNMVQDKKTGKYIFTVETDFPSYLRGKHCIDIYYGGAPICGYLINFH